MAARPVIDRRQLGSSPIAPFDRLFTDVLVLGRFRELALGHASHEDIARAGKAYGGKRRHAIADLDRHRLHDAASGLAPFLAMADHPAARVGDWHAGSHREHAVT